MLHVRVVREEPIYTICHRPSGVARPVITDEVKTALVPWVNCGQSFYSETLFMSMNSVSDYLVKLYDMPPLNELVQKLNTDGFLIKNAIVPEKHTIVKWVREQFGETWASECEVSFSRLPVSCFVAIHDEAIVGFCCYDATYKGFAGPLGIHEKFRGMHLGTALMLSCLYAMKHHGYAYAIMGAGVLHSYFIKQFNATLIDNSYPGIYANRLK